MSNFTRLDGKVALVTGGAGEIGQAITRIFLHEGASVVITGRKVEKLQAAVAAHCAEHPEWKDRLHFIAMDNSKEESILAGVQTFQQKFGMLDILINNAGVAGPREELANIPLTTTAGKEDLRDAVGSLLVGPWLTTKHFLPALAEYASVINISTIFSMSTYYGRAAYSVPKAALNTLSRLMAIELGKDPRKIRVNSVLPGPVDTDRIRRVFTSMDQLRGAPAGTTKSEVLSRMIIQKTEAEGEFIPREDVAETVLFLASNASRSCTGHGFEVARGFGMPDHSVCHLNFRRKPSAVPSSGSLAWIIAGDQELEVSEFIDSYRELGYDLLVTLQSDEKLIALKTKYSGQDAVQFMKFDIHSEEDWQNVESELKKRNPARWNVVVMPRTESWATDSVINVPTAQMQKFVHDEIEGSIVVAKRLEQLFKFLDSKLQSQPCVTFLSSKSDGKKNLFSRLKRGALQQLIRIWRNEGEETVKRGSRIRQIQACQLIRYENESPCNTELSFEWMVSLSTATQTLGVIDLVLDHSLDVLRSDSHGVWHGVTAVHETHLHRVALITGGSEGIGGAISRQLAASGAKVVIAERSSEKLEKIRYELISMAKELRFPNPEGRVLPMPNIDVTKLDTLTAVVPRVIEKYGRIDFLINNAGLTGAEEMAVDIASKDWDQTLKGNLVSNYYLIYDAFQHMKRQKFGHVINMSSFFGASRYGSVPYTNRSDYAVSKAGQIALVDALAGVLAPEVQINAIAPGPVDGARLNGTEGRPGLYLRRVRLIRENRRLNRVYECAVKSLLEGVHLPTLLNLICVNNLAELAKPNSPKRLGDLAAEILKDSQLNNSGAGQYLLTGRLFEKFLARLRAGGYLSGHAPAAQSFQHATEPFFPSHVLETEAAQMRHKMLNAIALGKMPTDKELAYEVAHILSHGILTGGVIFPSCGFRLEGSHLGDTFPGQDYDSFFGKKLASGELEYRFRGKTVFIFGNSMLPEMAHCAQLLSSFCRVVILGEEETKDKLARLPGKAERSQFVCGTDPAQMFEAAIEKFGHPGLVLSFPMGNVLKHDDGQGLPSIQEFQSFIDSNLTNHFQISRRAALISDCCTILVTPNSYVQSPTEQLWTRFVRDTLKTYTIAVAKEASFLPHRATFYQVGWDVEAAEFGSKMIALLGHQVAVAVAKSERNGAKPERNAA